MFIFTSTIIIISSTSISTLILYILIQYPHTQITILSYLSNLWIPALRAPIPMSLIFSCKVKLFNNIPAVVQHFSQTLVQHRLHHEVHLEEPSKTHQQTQHPFACYSAGCHLTDTGKPTAVHVGKNGIDFPMFQQHSLHCSYEIYTNGIELNHVKDSII